MCMRVMGAGGVAGAHCAFFGSNKTQELVLLLLFMEQFLHATNKLVFLYFGIFSIICGI